MPSRPAAARSRGRSPRSRGLVTASRMTAAKLSRRKVVPLTPSGPNSGLENAIPVCTRNIAVRHSSGAGMLSGRRRKFGNRRPDGRPVRGPGGSPSAGAPPRRQPPRSPAGSPLGAGGMTSASATAAAVVGAEVSLRWGVGMEASLP